MAASSITSNIERFIPRARLISGLLLFAGGLLILLLFGFNTEPGQMTTFGLNLGNQTAKIPDLVLPSQPSIYILTLVMFFLGGLQLGRGTKTSGALIFAFAFCFVAAFMLWAARDKSFSLVGMLSSTVVRATPIALAALCGVISERAAVVNIGVEGIMLLAACAAVITASVTDNLYIGLLVAVLTGGLVAALHAWLIIRFRVDQIISGVAINIFGAGATSFIASRFLEQNTDLLNSSGILPVIPIPGLAQIPILGPIFFQNSLIFYITIVLVVLLHILLFFTRWGLRTRAVGEHPKAADTLGVNVHMTRFVNVVLGGMIAGIGGAYFTIGSVGRFDEIMTAGKGFIGLAAVIFGKWNPIGAYLASLIFGFADSLQVKLQILRVPIPSEFLLMAPYIVTIVVLTGVVGRAVAPAADGQPYEK